MADEYLAHTPSYQDDPGFKARWDAIQGNNAAALDRYPEHNVPPAPNPIVSGSIAPMSSAPRAPTGGGDPTANGGYAPGESNYTQAIRDTFGDAYVDDQMRQARDARGAISGFLDSLTPYRKPATAPMTVSATTPRGGPASPAAGGGMQSGSADSQAVRAGAADARGDQRPGGTVSTIGGYGPTDTANTNARAQLDVMNARDAQNQQQADAAMAARNNKIISDARASEAERQLNYARDFGAGARYGDRPTRNKLGTLAAAAENARARATAADTADAAAQAGGRNFLQEAQTGQGIVSGARQAEQASRLGEQQVRVGDINASVQSHVADLQKRATQPGPAGDAAREALAIYQKAQQGKGGPLTEEDMLKVYGDMVSRATAVGGPEAYKALPNFNDFAKTLSNRGQTQQYPEGQTGTINGVRVKIVNGQPVRI